MSHEPRVLLGPGPSNVHPRVFQAMISPILGYLDPVFLEAMDETMSRLRYLFQTQNEFTVTLPGTGMAAMETAISKPSHAIPPYPAFRGRMYNKTATTRARLKKTKMISWIK